MWLSRYFRNFEFVPLIAKKPEKPQAEQGKRINAVSAGYMELEGAKKDGECVIVEVKNGISKDLGCCNLFDQKKSVTKFSCGTCSYLIP
jgi:hypothetical protein